MVVGTTGWDGKIDEVKAMVARNGASLMYSANFSLGVNIFLRTVREAARMIDAFDQFDIALSEQHHTAKADYPSGTALRAAQMVLDASTRKKVYCPIFLKIVKSGQTNFRWHPYAWARFSASTLRT